MMAKAISATDAKNNFGGLLQDVATLGRVNIVKHGRLVAVVLSAQALEVITTAAAAVATDEQWAKNHLIKPKDARRARMLKPPSTFDEG